MSPTGANPLTQSAQVIVTLVISAIRLSARRFEAWPVRKMQLVTHVVASAVYIRYEPILRRLSSCGFEPNSPGIFEMMG